jgi:ABC-2 type transport system permease protein
MNTIGLFTLIRREVERFFRVAIQSLVSPWVSAVLFILVFGKIVGARIGLIEGIPYIQFVLPGILMMNVTMSAFMQTSSSLYFQRFLHHIEEMLVAPFSHSEMITGFIVGGVIRGITVGLGIFLMGILFGATSVLHPFWLLFYILSVSLLFSLLGILIGLWAKGFESLAIVPTFLITPLSFLGGMFNSISMLPNAVQYVVRANPMFYLVDGLRYTMTGFSESNRLVGILLIIGCTLFLFFFIRSLFERGWRIRT